ncbi:hypothetical protein HK100_012340, partial [Physocladia obscura]
PAAPAAANVASDPVPGYPSWLKLSPVNGGTPYFYDQDSGAVQWLPPGGRDTAALERAANQRDFEDGGIFAKVAQQVGPKLQNNAVVGKLLRRFSKS